MRARSQSTTSRSAALNIMKRLVHLLLPTVGVALASHPGVDKIAFTGSTVTGKSIAHAAADGLKKVSLELGGKTPNIIMPDADLAKAIPASAMGIFYNSGQTCTAPSRLYVHRDVAEEVIASRSKRNYLSCRPSPRSTQSAHYPSCPFSKRQALRQHEQKRNTS